MGTLSAHILGLADRMLALAGHVRPSSVQHVLTVADTRWQVPAELRDKMRKLGVLEPALFLRILGRDQLFHDADAPLEVFWEHGARRVPPADDAGAKAAVFPFGKCVMKNKSLSIRQVRSSAPSSRVAGDGGCLIWYSGGFHSLNCMPSFEQQIAQLCYLSLNRTHACQCLVLRSPLSFAPHWCAHTMSFVLELSLKLCVWPLHLTDINTLPF